jgi:GNAT superfamily N-acetyltransferase
MGSGPPFKPIFEPLGTQHDRAAFHCGNERLDRYFHHQAGQDLRRYLAVPYVMVDPRSNKVAGYYTLTNYKIDAGELPPEITGRIPYPDVPATLIGRLAVDTSYQEHGLGGLLLMDALRRSLENAYSVASLAVVVDAIDEAASRFYQHYGFITFPGHPDRLFLTMATIQKTFEGES